MSWEYTDKEYIKVFRKMLRWEWYTDVNTTKLFLHCLLKANWKDGSWRGIKLRRGQFVTSLASLSRETGLSVRQVRTSLNHLKSTGEVTSSEYPKYRIITVNSYDAFQSSDKVIDKQATKYRQSSDKVATTDIRSIRSIEGKNPPKSPQNDDNGDEWDEEGWE